MDTDETIDLMTSDAGQIVSSLDDAISDLSGLRDAADAAGVWSDLLDELESLLNDAREKAFDLTSADNWTEED